jgi:hypothetical protein
MDKFWILSHSLLSRFVAMDDNNKIAVNDLVSFGGISWLMSAADDSVKHVTNSDVHAFTNSIGLRVLHSSRDWLDPIDVVKHGLKGNADEFSAWVMKDVKRVPN